MARDWRALIRMDYTMDHAITIEHSDLRRPKFIENSLLVLAGLIAHMPLYYQLPRWRDGLDPLFAHPHRIAQSPVPLIFHLVAVHPVIWIALVVLIFLRICQNYGWRLSK